MHPELFHIGKIVIHSYGFMLAISFLFGIWFSTYRAKKRGLDPNIISDLGFWVILSAIIGSRLYYVFLHFEEFKGDLGSIFNPFAGDTVGIGGLVMLGGFFGAITAGVLFFKIKKLPFFPYADTVAPAFGFGIFITRIGCFLNGCCYGKPTTHSLGVHFPNISPAGQYQVAMHADKLIPAQIFLSIGGLVIALLILLSERKKFFVGFQLYVMIGLYAVLRFSADFFRHYTADERIFGLSHNQIFCIGLFIVIAGLVLKNMLNPSPSPVESLQQNELLNTEDQATNQAPPQPADS